MGIAVCGVLAFSACKNAPDNHGRFVNPEKKHSTKKPESSLAEYLIVLKDNVSISDAVNSLKRYEVQVLRDLKKGRYLIGMKNDPGINQLQNELADSEVITHIQPNFTYTIQPSK